MPASATDKDVDDLMEAINKLRSHCLNRYEKQKAIIYCFKVCDLIRARQATDMRERNMPFEKLHNEPKPVFTPDFSGEPSLKTTYEMTRERGQ